MPMLDKRFALIRDGQPWYAAMIRQGRDGAETFRISGSGTRDAFKGAEELTDLMVVARRVLLEGKRMRCAAEGGPASSLYLSSNGVTGYRLDATIAGLLGVPPKA